MQTLEDGRTVYSATDLVGFLACENLTTLERAHLHGDLERPERDDPELLVLQRRGQEHEGRFLAYLRELGQEVVDGRAHGGVTREGGRRLDQIEEDATRTLELMRLGVDVIYQATLFDGTWLGIVDFLKRVQGESVLGDYHYEVVDTKLARRTKGSALLQMCVYSDLVAQIQGRLPEQMRVALGGSGHRIDSHRLIDYLAYYRSVKRRFLEAVRPDAELAYPLRWVPPPVDHCGVCRWDSYCSGLRADADHLSLVAGMRSDQAKRLEEAGVASLAALAQLPEPPPAVDGVSPPALQNLRQQASLQHRSRGLPVPIHEFLPVEPNLGLAGLPPPSRGDLFFDIEGDPYAEEDGLEYLLGVWDPFDPSPDGGTTFRSWWAHSRPEEKRAFEAFVDFVMDRWRTDPAMHVYHYAAYERGRMGMLSTRHATREFEVDKMLRAGLFVDLYKVVRQGLRIGTASYSIKKLEPLYGLERSGMKDAVSSIVQYEAYIRSVSAGTPDQAILAEIEAYNRDDCKSNQLLRDWLEEHRASHEERLGVPIPRPEPREGELERELSDRDHRIAELAGRLLRDVPLVPEQRRGDPELQGRWLLANLLEWHRREEKVEWWAYFERCSKSDAQLVDDDEAIGQIRWLREVDRPNRSVRHRYAFDPEQSYRLKEGDRVANPRTQREAGRIVALDALNGTLDLQWSARDEDRPHPTSLIPPPPLTADPQKAALERMGEWVAANGMRGPGMYRAARDYLLRQPPRAGQADGTPLVPVGESVELVARRLMTQLDETVLPIQGPPGAGKTYVGAEMILEAVRAGRRVGITAFTHRALTNLLDAVLDHAQESGQSLRAIRRIEKDEEVQISWRYDAAESNEDVWSRLREGSADVAAGTAWLWARSEMEGQLDTLFVDEAGQMSLANVIAVSGSARNVVLLGDPQQLSQVRKGAHPEGVDVSSLEFVLDGASVIDPRVGLFLPETHRLHPDVTAFTSEVFYEGKLKAAPETAIQSLRATGELTGTGVRWMAVRHTGNRNSSSEEGDLVALLYRDLLHGSWRDKDGNSMPLSPASILVVAPYNAQVELLAERLSPIAQAGPVPGDVRVGTVDKIQGQEAAAVVYSLATSSQDELPRSMEFLYSLNRLNVATSRGRCLAVIVGSPELLRVRVHTPFQMRLANAMCRFVELGSPAGEAGPLIKPPLEVQLLGPAAVPPS